jgi:hypothetical protein
MTGHGNTAAVGGARHFVYQRLNVLGGKALHLAEHLALAAGAFERIYGFAPGLDEREIAARVASLVHARHSPARTSATVLLRLTPEEGGGCDIAVEFERGLLEAGYAHSALRPRGVTYEYSIPYSGLPTNFQIESAALFDFLSNGAIGGRGLARSVRCEGDRLLACGDAALMAIRGRALITPPVGEGGVESVERRLAMEAAGRLRSPLEVREEPIFYPELKDYDELFFVDAAGITSFAECDGAKFMSIIAPRMEL